jgi:hypothetical protein
MGKNKPLEIDMIAGSQLRDTQGEMLDVAGADISDLESGRGRLNDNHGKGYMNSIGYVTYAKKIFKEEDCVDPRQKYYWEKVKAPFIYVRGKLHDNEDHPNARAASAIIRNIHKSDIPLKIKASVEGGVISRGISDQSLLARTKIHSVALTFTPANNATLVEPLNLDKSDSWAEDLTLIKSVEHLAETNVPSFRHIVRDASASKILNNIDQIKQLAAHLGLSSDDFTSPSKDKIIKHALEEKITNNINKLNELVKALTAGYGGAGAPTGLTGGGVLQPQSMKIKKKEDKFKFVTCDNCGKEQVHHKYQTKCRECNNSFSLEKLLNILV